jgi:hypothetical protein
VVRWKEALDVKQTSQRLSRQSVETRDKIELTAGKANGLDASQKQSQLNLDGIALAQVLWYLVIAVNDGRIVLSKVHPADVGFNQAIEGRNN